MVTARAGTPEMRCCGGWLWRKDNGELRALAPDAPLWTLLALCRTDGRRRRTLVAHVHADSHHRPACGIARDDPAWRARGATGTLGWYGFWFLDEQNKTGALHASRSKLERAGVKQVLYYDVGEVGDYAGFFTADGQMRYNGWSLPWWNSQEPLTARWVGLEAFVRDVPWAPYPTAKAYGLAPFTRPDGTPAKDLYAVLARRGLDDQWHFDYSSNPRITDELAQRSGLAGISGQQDRQLRHARQDRLANRPVGRRGLRQRAVERLLLS